GAGVAGGGDGGDGGDLTDHGLGLGGQVRGVAEQGPAGRDGEQVGAEGGQPAVQVLPAGGGDADDAEHGGDADGDAERRQEDPQRPGAQAGAAGAQDVGGAHAGGREDAFGSRPFESRHSRAPSTIRPSSMSTRRGRPSAMPRSWVMTT